MSGRIPEEFLCPISQSIMTDPVSLQCGHTFERENLEIWIQNNSSCPTCRARTSYQNIITNWAIKSLIDKYNNPSAQFELDQIELILNDNVVELKMTPKIFDLVDATCYSDGSDIDLCLTVVEETDKRRPVSIVCIIDVSGSMGSSVGKAEGGKAFTRLDLVKHVLNVIIASLTESDCLSLITFSNKPEVVLELMNMNKANKNLAINLVKTLKEDANTHTGPAIRRAYEMIKKSPENNIKSIILLTDGQDTDGDEMLQMAFDRAKKPEQVQFNTFGFSNEIYSHTLETLATKGGGIFGFIPDQSMIGTIFINFMANTFRTFAQDVLIELNDGFVFRHGKNNFKKTILQFGRSHHFLIKSKTSSREKLRLKIGLANDSMVELRVQKSNHMDDFKIQLARQKMLELLEDTNLPYTSLKDYENSDELKIPEFLAELKQIGKKDPNNEQIKLSLEYWDTWGAHYLRSFRYAHIYEQAINFKSPSMKFYRTPKFDEIIDKLTDIFCTLPPPKATGTVNSSPNTPSINMRYIMDRDNGCILSTCKVKLESGEFKQISELKKGDILEGGSKVVCLINSKYDGVLVKINDLQITPYHPVYLNGKWQFPIELYEANILNNEDITYPLVSLIKNEKRLNVCNIVLDKRHIVNIEGIKCITLGHGYKNDSVLRHPYYGTTKCIKDLSKLKGWNEGNIALSGFKTIRDDNGFVTGTFDHEY